MTRELAVIHARQNIRVNALCPGPLRTELLMNFLDTDEKKQRRLVHVPMGRFGLAKEMAQAALYLASDESSYMTGAEFTVDGGITAAYVTPEGSVAVALSRHVSGKQGAKTFGYCTATADEGFLVSQKPGHCHGPSCARSKSRTTHLARPKVLATSATNDRLSAAALGFSGSRQGHFQRHDRSSVILPATLLARPDRRKLRRC